MKNIFFSVPEPRFWVLILLVLWGLDEKSFLKSNLSWTRYCTIMGVGDQVLTGVNTYTTGISLNVGPAKNAEAVTIEDENQER